MQNKKYKMQPMNKVLPPKGSETWTLVSPEDPKKIKRIVQFSKDSLTGTIYISNIGNTAIQMQIDLDEMHLYPVEQYGSYVTSTDFARKIWSKLIDAGYKTV